MSQAAEISAQDQHEAHTGGAGTALVLLHGLTGTWHIWKPLIPLLEKQHRVIAITLPGHDGGPALAPGVTPTVSSIADGVAAALTARGISRAHFVGNSLGGWLSLEMARRGIAQSVVALSPAGSWDQPSEYAAVSTPFRQIYRAMPFVLIFMLLLGWIAPIRRLLLKQTMEHGDRMPVRDFMLSLFSFMKTKVLLPLLDAMGHDGSIRPLDAGNTPIRIIWSGSDRVIPLEPYGRIMFSRVPGAQQQVMPGVGHVPMYDDPESLAQSILEVTLAVDRAAVATSPESIGA